MLFLIREVDRISSTLIILFATNSHGRISFFLLSWPAGESQTLLNKNMPLLFLISHLRSRRDGVYRIECIIFSSSGVILFGVVRIDIRKYSNILERVN